MDLIKKIKEAEQKAGEIIAKAKADAAKKIEINRKKQLEALEQAENERKKAIRAAIELAQSQAALEAEELEKKADHERQQLRENVAGRIDSAAVKVVNHVKG